MIIQKEIGNLMLKLTNFPTIVEYQEKLIFLTSKDIFSLSNLILFINRKIRLYINNHLIPKIVLTTSDKSTIVISVLLGMNCFLELSVILVLFYLVLKRMINLNRIISKFIRFIE